MATLLLSPRNVLDYEPLTAAALAAGWSVQRLPRWRIDHAPEDGNVVAYGEPLFVAAVAQQLSLALLEPPFDWLSGLPREYLQRRVVSSTLGSLAAGVFPAFIKPADDKCFPAGVYSALAEFPVLTGISLKTAIIVSEPVTWELEFRSFICERQCVGLSIYERAGRLAQLPDGSWPAAVDELRAARTFLQTLLDDDRVAMPPGLVVDIGRISDRGWAVIEANPAWGAGIYGCEARGVLRAIARACRSQAALTAEDRQWIIERSEGETAS